MAGLAVVMTTSVGTVVGGDTVIGASLSSPHRMANLYTKVITVAGLENDATFPFHHSSPLALPSWRTPALE